MDDRDEPCDKPATTAGKPAEQSCQVCGETLTRRRVVRCMKCKTLHHLECWRFNKGCSMYGCGCRSWEEAPSASSSALPESFERASGMTGARVGALLCGIYGTMALIATLPIALAAPHPWAALIPAAVAAGLLPVAARFGLCRDRLHADPEHRTLRRTLDLGKFRIATKDEWLSAAEVAELQLHEIVDGHRGAVLFALYALLTNGERKLLRKQVGPPTPKRQEEMNQLVERLAVFLDCTVRRIEGRTPPSQAEIREAIAQKRLQQAPQAPSEELPRPAPEAERPRTDQRPERTR